jgi:hypothetical protein
MSLSVKIIKLAFITQNNHVYEHTAEGPTLKVLLNVRNPYRRQKRDLSIIRSLFRRSYWNRNTCDHTDYFTFLPITSTTLLPSCDWLLPTSYLPTFLPHHRLLLTFLRLHPLLLTFLFSCDRLLPTFLSSYLLTISSTPSYLLAIDYSLSSYLLTFLPYYRLLLTFLRPH